MKGLGGMIKGEFGPRRSKREFALPPSAAPRVALDQHTKAIIELLQQDGRRPYAEIAEQLDLAPELVEQRVEELLNAEVIQIVAVTDPLQLGFGRQAMVGVNVEGPAKPVAQALALIEEVDYVVLTSGGFDILAEVVGRSDAHLLELISGRMRAIPGVTAIQTLLYLELQKQTYTWGVHET